MKTKINDGNPSHRQDKRELKVFSFLLFPPVINLSFCFVDETAEPLCAQ